MENTFSSMLQELFKSHKCIDITLKFSLGGEKMRKNVYIDPKCLALSLIPSAIEEYHKEVSGYIIGSNGKLAKKLKVISAYPIQSDIKKRTFVIYLKKRLHKTIL